MVHVGKIVLGVVLLTSGFASGVYMAEAKEKEENYTNQSNSFSDGFNVSKIKDYRIQAGVLYLTLADDSEIVYDKETDEMVFRGKEFSVIKTDSGNMVQIPIAQKQEFVALVN